MFERSIDKLKRIFRNCLQLDRMVESNHEYIKFTMRELRKNIILQHYELLFLQGGNSGITNQKYEDKQLIVSLTTYGQRIHKVYLTLESLLRQTQKPNKIILWLDEKEFSYETIPASLKILEKRGIEIHYTEDIKSYKKLIPSLLLFPDDIIITVDDDCIYPANLIDVLYSQHTKNPADIICSHAHIIEFDSTGHIKPYIEWSDPPKNTSRASLSYLPVGFGGILYPPHSLHPDVFRKDLFMTLSPTADDIWFKIMAILNNVSCRTAPLYEETLEWITTTNGKYDQMLNTNNVHYNNIQLENLLKHYNLDQYSFDIAAPNAERLIPELYQETEEQWILFLKHKYAYEYKTK